MSNVQLAIDLPPIDTVLYCIKTLFMLIYTLYILVKINNLIQIKKSKIILSVLFMLIIAFFSSQIRDKTGIYNSILFQFLSLVLIIELIYKDIIKNVIVNTIIAYGISYIIFGISVLIASLPVAFLNIENDYLILVIIVLLYSVLVYKILNINKIKNGLIILKDKMKNENINLLILNISVMILFSAMLIPRGTLTKYPVFAAVIIFLAMYITIKKSFDVYYKQTLLIQDLNDTKAKLEEKTKEVEELEKENLEYGKRSHTLAHKQKILENKVNELMNSEISLDIDLKDEVKNLSKQIYGEKKQTELVKTEVSSIDDVLKCMQNECISKNIDFELQVNGNIHYMINHFVGEEELQILIADHVKDAIIAIENSDNTNRSILVKIGEIDGIFSLYIYDSGIEFEKTVLDILGKKPVTTHKEDGGTGMGFMNTFETLKKYNASLIIKEIGKESESDYTKIIMIRFDNNGEFKIETYK